MSGILYNEKYRRPSISFTEMLKKGASGQYREKGEYSPFMFRAVVIAVDEKGAQLECPEGGPATKITMSVSVRDTNNSLLAQYDVSPTLGPNNPKNSIRARIVSNNIDQVMDDDNLRTFWPMFPDAELPAPGEQVYVVFEDEAMKHGLWINRVPTTETDKDNFIKKTKNIILMSDTLKGAQKGKTMLFPDKQTIKPAGGGPPIKQPQRLTALFINKGGK